MSQRLALGFLLSHGGSALRGVLDAIAADRLDACIRLAIANNAEAPGLAHAAVRGVETRHLSAAVAGGPAAADRAIAAALAEAGVGLVVLSGYLRPVGPATLARFPRRVLNIHPALLPRHGGRGMFGRHVHEAVLAAGDTETGATVHLVDGDYDHGQVLAQARVPVLPGDTVDTLQARVMAIEPGLMVRTLQAIAAGSLVLPPP